MVSWVLVEENLTLAAGVLIDISTLFFFHMILDRIKYNYATALHPKG